MKNMLAPFTSSGAKAVAATAALAHGIDQQTEDTLTEDEPNPFLLNYFVYSTPRPMLYMFFTGIFI